MSIYVAVNKHKIVAYFIKSTKVSTLKKVIVSIFYIVNEITYWHYIPFYMYHNLF